jgi:hypothetical protein
MGLGFTEKVWEKVDLALTLHTETPSYQHIDGLKTESFGRMLLFE